MGHKMRLFTMKISVKKMLDYYVQFYHLFIHFILHYTRSYQHCAESCLISFSVEELIHLYIIAFSHSLFLLLFIIITTLFFIFIVLIFFLLLIIFLDLFRLLPQKPLFPSNLNFCLFLLNFFQFILGIKLFLPNSKAFNCDWSECIEFGFFKHFFFLLIIILFIFFISFTFN